MSSTHATGEACSRNCSTQNAVPTEQVTQVNKKTQPVKPGRPMTTHRKEDEELFKHLRNNPEGIGIEGKNGKYQSGTSSNQVSSCVKMKNYQNANFENKGHKRLEVNIFK